jgi:hypothetical protein
MVSLNPQNEITVSSHVLAASPSRIEPLPLSGDHAAFSRLAYNKEMQHEPQGPADGLHKKIRP